MNKIIFLLCLTIIALPSCGQKKKQARPVTLRPRTEVVSATEIPLANDDIRSFFDDDINDFALLEDDNSCEVKTLVQTSGLTDIDETDEFAWVNEIEKEQTSKVVYFDFDRYTIREDQKEAVAYDIAYVKEELKKADDRGYTPAVVINGHADHSAGSAAYNLALSEKRAKAVADKFAAEGISTKTVGRGTEVPAVVNGKKVTGSRDEQAANRRADVSIIYS
jgi:outer membrane protein OmpA-like peptidoglycan-associated protein